MLSWTANPFANGSAWLQADFHLHTRADREFAYPAATDEQRNIFVAQYVDSLQRAGIRVGLIANHNKFDLGEFKALRKRAKSIGIFLLPGVELSVNDGTHGIHILIAFGNVTDEVWKKNIEESRSPKNQTITSG